MERLFSKGIDSINVKKTLRLEDEETIYLLKFWCVCVFMDVDPYVARW